MRLPAIPLPRIPLPAIPLPAIPGVRTVRLRLALTTSLWLFVISAVILLGVYVALAATIDARQLDPVTVKRFIRTSDGTLIYKPGESFQAADLAGIQQAVNKSTLETLRNYSLIALAVISLISIMVGWIVAGRVLRPIGDLTSTAHRLRATDLSERFNASGPRDELRTLAETLDGMLDRIDEAFRAERALVADVSHELRNPVAVIQANVEAVLADDRATAAERSDALIIVSRQTTRMSRLLDDLLATARRRSGSFADQPVAVGDFITEIADDHALLAEDSGKRIDARAPTGPVVFADPESLGRAVSNLIGNALRLAPAHSIVTVGGGSVDGWAWIAVADEGPGIADADRQRIFERFRRVDNGTLGGSGLGLTIARQIIESHEGRLEVHSELGVGSTFIVWLPDRAEAARPDRSGRPPSQNPMSPAPSQEESTS